MFVRLLTYKSLMTMRVSDGSTASARDEQFARVRACFDSKTWKRGNAAAIKWKRGNSQYMFISLFM